MKFKKIALAAAASSLSVAAPMALADTLTFETPGTSCLVPALCVPGIDTVEQGYGDVVGVLDVKWDAHTGIGGMQDFGLASGLPFPSANRLGVGAPAIAPATFAEVFFDAAAGQQVTVTGFSLGSLIAGSHAWEIRQEDGTLVASGTANTGAGGAPLAQVLGTWTSAAGGGIRVRFDVLNGISSAAIDDINYSVAPIPEPSTYALLLAGLGMMGLMMRRRTRSA